MQGPFLASEQLAAGRLTRRDLRRSYVKVFQDVYVPRDMQLTARDRAIAAWLWSGRTAPLMGLSAAIMHGSAWVPDDAPAELLRDQHHSPPGILIHRGAVPADELCVRAGIDCTTVPRTAYDLGRRLSFEEAVIRIDALLNGTGVPVEAIAAIADRYPGARNIRRLRRILEFVDGGAESPQESRVRLILVNAGLPRPQTQIGVGRRRVDMGWPRWRVGVEYDGQQHWTDPAVREGDIDRHDYLAAHRWRIIRVSARHLRYPSEIVRRAATALQSAGCDLVAES